MPTFKASKIPRPEIDIDEQLARLCFYYPQYKFLEAAKLPAKRVRLLLTVAMKERARFLFDLTQAIAAPHTTKGKGVKSVGDYFRSIIEG